MLFNNEAPAGKTPSLKFPTPGTKHHGTITRISDPLQARKYGTDEPDTWRSGKPKMQVCVTLQTGEVDPSVEDHAGEWGLWVLNDFSRPEKSLFPDSLLHAIQKAVAKTGAPDLEPGGTLTVEFYGTDPESKNPANPRKMYRAAYQPPAAGGGMFAGAEEPDPTAQVQQEPPAAQQGGSGLSQEDENTIRTMAGANVTKERIATALGVTVGQVVEVLGRPPF